MLGSPAVFVSEQESGWLSANTKMSKTRGFPPPLHNGFGLGCFRLTKEFQLHLVLLDSSRMSIAPTTSESKSQDLT